MLAPPSAAPLGKGPGGGRPILGPVGQEPSEFGHLRAGATDEHLDAVEKLGRLGRVADEQPFDQVLLDWFDEYRKQHCAKASCPGAPLPGAEPIECARVARCVRGKCARACDDPSYRRGGAPSPE